MLTVETREKQSDELSEPSAEVCPLGQLVQEDRSDRSYLPAAHQEQLVRDAVSCLPAGQERQLVRLCRLLGSSCAQICEHSLSNHRWKIGLLSLTHSPSFVQGQVPLELWQSLVSDPTGHNPVCSSHSPSLVQKHDDR